MISSMRSLDMCWMQDVTLNDGETIGFSAEEKLPITCAEGRSLDQKMLQIGYQSA